MEYNYPSKDILEKNSKEIRNNDDLYNLSNITYKKYNSKPLSFPIGKDNNNEVYYLDLSNISSILITGETGTGKSNFIHSMLISILLKNNNIELVLIDPKQVELQKYLELPNTFKLLGNNTLNSLKDLTYVLALIEERKKLDNLNNVKDVIVVIDEITDIMDFEYTDNILDNIISVASNYKIHVVLSTNLNSKEYISKRLLNKFDFIITFDLADESIAKYIKMDGAHLLKSNGDALIKNNNEIVNIQTPYVSESDINKVIDYLNKKN